MECGNDDKWACKNRNSPDPKILCRGIIMIRGIGKLSNEEILCILIEIIRLMLGTRWMNMWLRSKFLIILFNKQKILSFLFFLSIKI
jgi:hypothetical protein